MSSSAHSHLLKRQILIDQYDSDSSDDKSNNNNELILEVSTIGSYEEMLHWRQKYLNLLDQASLYGDYRLHLVQDSRTWWLRFYFTDKRDAVFFKLVLD